MKSVHRVRYVALDMDGVLKIGDTPVLGADETVKELILRGYKLMIVTNECRWTPDQLSEKLRFMGLPICAALPIYTAGMAARDYMLQLSLQVPKRNIFGANGLREVLEGVMTISDTSVIVIGTHGTEDAIPTINMKTATKIIVTCSDLLDPSTTTLKMPLQVLAEQPEQPNGTTKIVSVGKPHSTVIDAIIKHFNVDQRSDVLFIGDTLYTDILLARRAGFQSALVLTGNTNVAAMLKAPEDQRPDVVLSSVNDVLLKLPSL
jgi:ribonucleotide monophosphatase NagD (HAD superfamily)